MNIYQENILDHYRNPRNKGRLKNPTVSIDHSNPVCGDRLHLEAIVEGETVQELRFEGQGCAISLAAASILSEMAPGEQLEELTDQRLLDELGIDLSPARTKCALLGISGLRQAVHNAQQAEV